MAKIMFWLVVSEIKCFVFQQSKVNPYKIYKNYIKINVDFHPIIFLGNKKTKSLPSIFVIYCIISC